MNQMCYREIKHSLNDRTAYGGRHLKDHSFPAPCRGLAASLQIMLLTAPSWAGLLSVSSSPRLVPCLSK